MGSRYMSTSVTLMLNIELVVLACTFIQLQILSPELLVDIFIQFLKAQY